MVSQADANSFSDNPARFMKTNLITTLGTTPVAQTVVTVAMEDVFYGGEINPGRRRTVLRTKVNTMRYQLRILKVGNAGGAATFQALWSGYVSGGGSTASLPAAGGPNIMLTPELTGCAVVARTNPDGSADFSHYNLVDGAATLSQPDMEAIAQAQYGGGQSVLTKETYRRGNVNAFDLKCNVVGFRRNGSWEFWCQFQESKNSGLQLREVRRLV